jgi:hypothetical protein
MDDIEAILTRYWETGWLEHVNSGSELNPVDLWATLRRCAHRFSFDSSVAFEQVHMKFAQNSIDRRIFRLPFPVVIYEFASHFANEEGEDANPARELVMIADLGELPHVTLIGHEHEPAHTKFVVMGGFTFKGGSANGYTSILSPAVVRLRPSGLEGCPIFQMSREGQ